MTYEEIDAELTEWEGDIFFVNMLPSFVWSQSIKQVVEYSSVTTDKNRLVVLNTEIVDLGKKTLSDYLKDQGATDQDVLVFCINQDYYPKKKGNFIRIHIIKNVNKKKYDTGRIRDRSEEDLS